MALNEAEKKFKMHEITCTMSHGCVLFTLRPSILSLAASLPDLSSWKMLYLCTFVCEGCHSENTERIWKCFQFHTHDDNVGHALERGLFDLWDPILVDAQLLQALGNVGGHLSEHVLRQVETLQLGEGHEGLWVDRTDFIVHQDQSLRRKKRPRRETQVLYTVDVFAPAALGSQTHYDSLSKRNGCCLKPCLKSD